jgi:hypothetical protein
MFRVQLHRIAFEQQTDTVIVRACAMYVCVCVCVIYVCVCVCEYECEKAGGGKSVWVSVYEYVCVSARDEENV